MEKDYKSTLLMMNTAFSMKANLPNKEPEIQKRSCSSDERSYAFRSISHDNGCRC